MAETWVSNAKTATDDTALPSAAVGEPLWVGGVKMGTNTRVLFTALGGIRTYDKQAGTFGDAEAVQAGQKCLVTNGTFSMKVFTFDGTTWTSEDAVVTAEPPSGYVHPQPVGWASADSLEVL
jgi:hypothetical protein